MKCTIKDFFIVLLESFRAEITTTVWVGNICFKKVGATFSLRSKPMLERTEYKFFVII